MEPKKKSNIKVKDPLFGLKYIAYCRTGLSVNSDDLGDEDIVNFAKWQICKVRNVLWNDPVWESYTPHEILIEFFSIKFDEDEKLRQDFETGLVSVKEDDLEWLERMEAKYVQEHSKISEGESKEEEPKEPEDFEETFK